MCTRVDRAFRAQRLCGFVLIPQRSFFCPPYLLLLKLYTLLKEIDSGEVYRPRTSRFENCAP
jgi:hypothetical protein